MVNIAQRMVYSWLAKANTTESSPVSPDS